MATVVEFVHFGDRLEIPAVGLLAPRHGVTFFSIGPIGATILAVELLKLPLAIWTLHAWAGKRGSCLVIGLPLICVLTFQLVKDMAVYEMGVA